MRRGFSILLIVFFGLGPLAAILSASDDDSRLPACCRRHGAHHCTMSISSSAMMAEAASGKHTVTAPSTCPYFPGYNVAPRTTIHALTASSVSLPALLAQSHTPAAARAAARVSQIRTRAGRGPPSSSLA